MSKKYRFEEIFAKIILSNNTDIYSRLDLADKPDLQDPIYNIGVEVSIAAYQRNMQREIKFRHLLSECDNINDEHTIGNLRKLLCEQYEEYKPITLVSSILDITWTKEFYDYEKRHTYIKDLIKHSDYWTLWKLQCLFDHNSEGIFPALDNKISKIKTYKKFDFYDLFLFSDELFTHERLSDLSDPLYEKCKTYFRFVYLWASSSTSFMIDKPCHGWSLITFDISKRSYIQRFFDATDCELLYDIANTEYELLNRK